MAVGSRWFIADPAVAVAPVMAVALGLGIVAGWQSAAGAVLGWALGAGGHGPIILAMLLGGVAQAGLLALTEHRAARRPPCRVRDGDHLILLEMQHRTANALQFLASLLSLKADQVEDAEAGREALRDAAERLGTTARLHRRLNDPDISGPRLAELLRETAADLLAARGLAPLGDAGVTLRVEVDAAPHGLDPVRATQVAMIVVEAVTNAAKHAFGARGRGQLAIGLRRAGVQMRLSIRDDGPGLAQGRPADEGLGVMVMEAMARRLGGRFSLGPGPDGGAEVMVVFPADTAVATPRADARCG